MQWRISSDTEFQYGAPLDRMSALNYDSDNAFRVRLLLPAAVCACLARHLATGRPVATMSANKLVWLYRCLAASAVACRTHGPDTIVVYVACRPVCALISRSHTSTLQGADVLFPDGYDRMVNGSNLGRNLDIRLNSNVIKIDYRNYSAIVVRGS